MAKKNLERGTRVQILDTMLYNGRVGTLQSNSGELDDPWDFNVLLDSATPPEDASASEAKLYEQRTIGVYYFQVKPI